MVGGTELGAIARHTTGRKTPAEVIAAFTKARAEFIDDDIEWVEPFGTLRGADRVLQELLIPHTQHIEYLSFEAEHCFPTRGTAVCVFGRSEAKFRGGPRFDGRFVRIWEFRDGRAVRMTAYNEDGVIQRALGLPPDAPPEDVAAAAQSLTREEGDRHGRE